MGWFFKRPPLQNLSDNWNGHVSVTIIWIKQKIQSDKPVGLTSLWGSVASPLGRAPALVIIHDPDPNPISCALLLITKLKLNKSLSSSSKTREPRLLLTLPVTTADEGSQKLIGRSITLLVWMVHNNFLFRVLPLVGLSSVLLTVMVIVLVVTTLISRSSQVLMPKRTTLHNQILLYEVMTHNWNCL